MKAMILAAGLGERMRPLTDHTPKPLLKVGGVPIIEYHLRQLSVIGVKDVVINVSHLAQQIVDFCGDGSAWGLNIAFSQEVSPLETAGGIQQALPLLGGAPFMLINGDVWLDYPLRTLQSYELQGDELAHLVMVDNPPHHPKGDFCLHDDGRVSLRKEHEQGFTYAGVGLYAPAMFAELTPGKLALRPLLEAAIAQGRLSAEHHKGQWEDVGTPERLQALDERLQ